MEDLNEAPETIEELFNGRPHLGFEQSGTCCLFRLIVTVKCELIYKVISEVSNFLKDATHS